MARGDLRARHRREPRGRRRRRRAAPPPAAAPPWPRAPLSNREPGQACRSRQRSPGGSCHSRDRAAAGAGAGPGPGKGRASTHALLRRRPRAAGGRWRERTRGIRLRARARTRGGDAAMWLGHLCECFRAGPEAVAVVAPQRGGGRCGATVGGVWQRALDLAPRAAHTAWACARARAQLRCARPRPRPGGCGPPPCAAAGGAAPRRSDSSSSLSSDASGGGCGGAGRSDQSALLPKVLARARPARAAQHSATRPCPLARPPGAPLSLRRSRPP